MSQVFLWNIITYLTRIREDKEREKSKNENSELFIRFRYYIVRDNIKISHTSQYNK
jgi:hypothetical protein